MNCDICYSKYNNSTNKPITLMPCGHCFCLKCVDNLRLDNYICPTCRDAINSEKPNYSVLNILNSNAKHEINSKLKQKITLNLKDIEETQRKFYLEYAKKVDETKDTFNLVKRKINLKTTELMNMLLTNQESLLLAVEALEAKYNIELENGLQINHRQIEKIKSKDKDINKMSQNELNIFKAELENAKYDINFKINKFDEINFFCEFKPNDKLNVTDENILGDVLYSEANDPLITVTAHKKNSIKITNRENVQQTQPIMTQRHRSSSSSRPSEVKVKIYSVNHDHYFNLVKNSEDWICDGAKIFGSCISNIDSCGKSCGKIRYRCSVCPDFDLCHNCLLAPKIENENRRKSVKNKT